MEMEKDQKIAFLDVQIEREETVVMHHLCFSKKTKKDTHRPVHTYNSRHHSRIKSGVIK